MSHLILEIVSELDVRAAVSIHCPARGRVMGSGLVMEGLGIGLDDMSWSRDLHTDS